MQMRRKKAKRENAEEEIEKRLVGHIAEQLDMCPSSIILIDKVQDIVKNS